MQFSDEQRQILDFGVGNQVVLAGAGTGKTETLTQRVLHLLTRGAAGQPCELHQLIALTFTDKAAGEMRQRIYQGILQHLAATEDEAARARLDRLRADFADHNRIGTFDGFNHRLLSLYVEKAPVPPGFEPMSDYDERDLRAQQRRAFWEHAETLQDAARADLFDLLNRYDRRQLLNLIDRLACEEPERLRLLAQPIDEAAFEEELQDLAGEAKRHIWRRARRKMERLWATYIRSLPQHIPAELSDALTDPGRLSLSRKSDVVTKQNTFVKKFIKPFDADLCARIEATAFPLLWRWRCAESRAEESLAALEVTEETLKLDLESRRVLRRLAPLALWWTQKRDEMCRANGWIDFIQMQRAARDLLQDATISQRLRQGTRHILIDEFQDTNIEQWELIENFRLDDNVLIVGDGKQAIYQFRGGDITVFDEVRAKLIGERPPDPLAYSFRSSGPILEFCNQLFQELLPLEEEREPFEAPFQALRPGRTKSDPHSAVRVIRAAPALVAAEESKNESKNEAAVRERQVLAETTALLLAEIQADGDAGMATRRPEFAFISDAIRKNEAAVVGLLFRTHARKAEFEAALRAHGVRCTSVQGIGFFQSEPVRDAINLANFFFDSADSLALAGILRSPLVGLSDAALLELRIAYPEAPMWQAVQELLCGVSKVVPTPAPTQPPPEGEELTPLPSGGAGGGFTPLPLEQVIASASDRQALHIGFERLCRWREAVRIRPLSEVLEMVLRESEIAFYDALAPDAPQRAENWRKVIEIVRDREGRGHGSVRELAEFLVAQAGEEEKESEAALPASGAIQLMTVYAAKGLGFPLVILGQMDDTPAPGAETLKRGAFPTRERVHLCLKVEDPQNADNASKPGDPLLWTILKEHARAQEEAEFRRLLYVACTRAREHLLLVLPEHHKPDSWADMVLPFVAGKPVITSDEMVRRAPATDSGLPAASAELPRFDEQLLRPLPADAPPEDVSVTQVIHELQGAEAASRALGESPSGADVFVHRVEWGRVVHRLLELGADSPHRLVQARNLALCHDLPEAAAPGLLRQAEGAESWMEQRGFAVARARHEVPFTVPAHHLRHVLPERYQGAQWVSGVIDLLIPLSDSAADRWALIDFKTHAAAMPPESLIERWHYDRQLQIYAAAASALGLSVRECWLLFMSEDGTVVPVKIETQPLPQQGLDPSIDLSQRQLRFVF